MNAAHLHIVLVHVPVILIPVGALLLGVGLWRRSVEVRTTAYGFFVGAAVLLLPAYLLGESAEELVEHVPGVVESAIDPHEDAAEVGLWFSMALGVASLGVLAGTVRAPLNAAKFHPVVLTLALITSAVLGYSAQLGGKIRHPEAFEFASASNGQTEKATDND